MFWKILIFVVLSFVLIAGISFPIVENPTQWYELPLIKGLGENAKIIFYHVPTAWLTVLAFLMSTIYGIKYLRKKNMDDDAKSYVAAQLGMVFCILATVTGAVWAKFNWGTYWNWDPRQTSIFALLLIYGAWFALRSSIENEEKRASLAAVYSIIAFLTVPFFIFIMPRIMPSLHPGSSIGNEQASNPAVDFKMNMNMRIIFMISLAGFTGLYFWIWSIGSKAAIYSKKITKTLIED